MSDLHVTFNSQELPLAAAAAMSLPAGGVVNIWIERVEEGAVVIGLSTGTFETRARLIAPVGFYIE